jgi:Rieske 2Fe-2S family protein
MPGPAADGSLIPTLPGSWYTDPAVFAREQQAIFDGHWLCVARSGDIPVSGQFLAVQAGSESVLVVRQRDGGLRAFLNVCRHRGARLCLEESGEATRYLRFSYHAWSYDLGGHLAAAPNLAKMPDIDREAYGLVPVALREWLGYAWVCLARQPPSFEHTVIGAVTQRLATRGPSGRMASAISPSGGASPTASRRTGSSSSRTSWSATTAPRSTRN